EIFTLIPGSSAEMREALKADVLALGTELGRLPDEMLPAVYNALSAGIPEENLLTAVRTASEAARAGVSDLDTTLKLGVGILNAQVGGVDSLKDIYDQLFFTVKNGVVTMPELTDVMSQVTSIAGEAGVSMQDISAAMIVMTRQGDSAAEAAELLSIMLTQLSTSGTTLASTFEQAAGQSFRSFIEEGGNLAGAMEILQTHANNTGQALGDILGGGSPFFRDTQAARGALELTGKHLEDLIRFANEAENQNDSMGEAAAEMGEAAELGALQAKAAFEEFKIAAGEALAKGLEPLLKNSVEFLTIWSGNKANRVGQMADDLIEAAQNSEELVDAGQRIDRAYEEATGSVVGLIASGKEMRTELTGSAEEIVSLLAEQSGSFEEFKQQLTEIGAIGADGTFALLSGYEFNPEEVFQTAKLDEVAYSLEQIDQKMIQVAGTTTTAIDHSNAYGQTLEELAQLGRLEAQTQKDRQDKAVAAAAIIEKVWETTTTAATGAFNESNEAITAALEAEREALVAMRTEYNGYALDILNGQAAEQNWTNALFQTASQAGINQGQFYELAMATGEYSEAQIRAALTEAAMKQAVEELSGQLANGKITVDEAVEALENFEAALANDYTAELDYSTFKDGEEQAKKTKQALKEAEGNYSATFTNTTINKTINEGSTSTGGGTGGGGVGSAGSGGDNPVSYHQGGRFGAGELMMVGDGPGGKFIPGISEFVIFDQPGTVIGAKDSADLFAGQSLPPGFSTATQPVTDFVTNSTQTPTALVQFTGDINIHNDMDVEYLLAQVEEKVREAMEQR
ncbi:MAG: phage tail tape measure protein, partial [Anaerolineales bacterium]|nr:phage tail tape measure protein [Anaerolineales bacterium]